MTKSYSAIQNIEILNEPAIAYLVETVRSGIRFSLFDTLLQQLPFSLSEWARYLHLSERSLQRYKKEKKNFDTLPSEKILQIALLYKRGIEVFGDKSKFDQWLETKNLSLGGVLPKSLLDNTFGIQMLDDEFGRMEHGILA